MSQSEPRTPPPVTGVAEVDAAVAAVALGDDVNDHHQQFATALDSLQRALNPPPADPRR
ncbi:MAG: hypothetical protein WCF12_10015 [Propionicimonas sp.]